MKTNMIRMSLILSQLFLACLVWAGVPVKYPTCAKNLNLNSVENGAGVYFDADCSIAYVLPPVSGHVVIDEVQPVGNIQTCDAYEDLMQMYVDDIAHLKEVNTRINHPQGQGPLSSSGGGRSLEGPSVNVPQIATVDPNLIAEYSRTNDAAIQIRSELKDAGDPNTGVANAKISYYINWQSLVDAYKKANPRMHFEKLPLEAGRILFSRKIGNLNEGIAGVVLQNINGIDNSSGVSADGTLNSSTGSVIMGEAMSGTIVLNMAGACPFVVNGHIPKDLSATAIDASLGANFEYRYSLQSLRGYKATYNLALIAKHIQESHNQGGFFHSSTSNSVVDTNSSADEFNLEIYSNQASYEYDQTLRQEVKTELINRVLNELALVNGQSIQLPSLTAPGPHGASVAADELAKVPNIYTQVAGATLKILDSILGQSDAVATYVRQNDSRGSETVTEKRMFNYNGSMVFEGSAKK